MFYIPVYFTPTKHVSIYTAMTLEHTWPKLTVIIPLLRKVFIVLVLFHENRNLFQFYDVIG